MLPTLVQLPLITGQPDSPRYRGLGESVPEVGTEYSGRYPELVPSIRSVPILGTESRLDGQSISNNYYCY